MEPGPAWNRRAGRERSHPDARLTAVSQSHCRAAPGYPRPESSRRHRRGGRAATTTGSCQPARPDRRARPAAGL